MGKKDVPAENTRKNIVEIGFNDLDFFGLVIAVGILMYLIHSMTVASDSFKAKSECIGDCAVAFGPGGNEVLLKACYAECSNDMYKFRSVVGDD